MESTPCQPDGRSLLHHVQRPLENLLECRISHFTEIRDCTLYRIVCLGGSTTYGRPFYDCTSFPGWLRKLLPTVEPSRRWEVINAGGISYASYRALGVMEELAQYAPDLFIVYTGQNEFLERRTYQGLSDSNSGVTGPLSLVFRTRTAAVVRNSMDLVGIRRPGASHPASVLGEEIKAIPLNAVGPEAYERDAALNNDVLEHFRATLQSMVNVAEEAKADILFVAPASNLADFAPFRSQHRAGLSDTDLANWNQHKSKAESRMSQGDQAAALVEINEAQMIDDRYAELWFLKGQALQALSEFDAARQSFRRARDEDVCPLRAIEPIVNVLRSVSESNGKAIVDFELLVEQHSEHGLPGTALFHDHVHLTVEANRLLALAIIDDLQNRGIVQPEPTWGDDAIRQVTIGIQKEIDRPLHARQLRLLAAMMGWLRQPKAARTQADLSLELSGRSESALLELANGLQANNAAELAMEYFQEAVKVAPASAQTHFGLAVCALETGSEQLAIQHLNTAVELDPSFTEAQIRLGITLATQGNLKQAEEHLAAAVKLSPNSGITYNNLGLVKAKQGQYQEALALYQKSLSLDRNASSTHYNAGLAYEQLGQFEQAKSHYLATLHLAHDHPGAQERLHALRNR